MESNIHNFLSYINTPLSEEEISYIYRINNISYDRVLLYNDFIITFFELMGSTYMGGDIMTNNDEKSHFEWCVGKCVKIFKKEGIIFKTTDELKEFLFGYVREMFYDEQDKDVASDKIIGYWEHILRFYSIKSKYDMDSLLEINRIMNTSLLNKH